MPRPTSKTELLQLSQENFKNLKPLFLFKKIPTDFLHESGEILLD